MPLLPHKSKLYEDKPYVPKLKRATHYIQILLFSSASYWQSNHNVMPMMRDETVFRVILFICFMSRRWNVYCTSKYSRFHFLKFTCLYEPPVLMSKLYFTFFFIPGFRFTQEFTAPCVVYSNSYYWKSVHFLHIVFLF